MPPKTTRRVLLAGWSVVAAAISAAASPTGTAGTELFALGVKLNTETDAELLALGVKLDKVSAEMNRHDQLAKSHALDDETLDATRGALNDRLNGLCDSRTAQSPAGLAVQTRAIMLVAADLWAQEEAGDERAFIEAVGRFVGVAPPTAHCPNDPKPPTVQVDYAQLSRVRAFCRRTIPRKKKAGRCDWTSVPG